MKTALELLQSYQDNIQSPGVAAALFAEDGDTSLAGVGSMCAQSHGSTGHASRS
ncbi:hypothetical protein [Scleromatobacter humisilvae]|uniref:Uncharacterized protein n=1 Tax=Scleromatobacter humisilvae TaxID=2897159 RepID=A0A9X2C1U1_9BURK|nr:hypothetical protein [Scleromatobacter humisilvae]MCK9687946.1 hypothetical protein [Scleromatobacter humisilvae]